MHKLSFQRDAWFLNPRMKMSFKFVVFVTIFTMVSLFSTSCGSSSSTPVPVSSPSPTVVASPTPYTLGATWYVAPNGNDSNDGTFAAPFKSITKAQSVAAANDLVYLRGGTYTNFTIAASDTYYNYVHNITKSGIRYEAYPGENPVFDFSTMTTEKRVAAFHIVNGISKVTFVGLTVTGVPVGTQKQSECFRIEGNVAFIRVTCRDNAANGFYFTTDGSGSCTNCDAYNNIGVPGYSIGNTDGFGAHSTGNVTFRYCRSWNNSDDGFDCIASSASNTFEGCWAFNMNTVGGDSNGFKIGGWGTLTPPGSVQAHIVRYCLAANNKAHGFYANHQPGQAANWSYNTAYNNFHGNFNMLERVSPADSTDIPGTREFLQYNISYQSTVTTQRAIIEEANLAAENVADNSWTKTGVSVSDADFVSMDVSQLSGARTADGSLPTITFMHLTGSSDLKGLGCFPE